jgi:hypothetical protein
MNAVIGLVILALLIIPTLAILIDSPIGRALARRVGGPEQPDVRLAELAKKVELLEGEIDDLHGAVEQLKDENQFLQRLLEDAPRRPTLPPGPAS